MANELSRFIGQAVYLGIAGTLQTKTGLALGSAYTYGSAGAAHGVRFIAPVSGNLTDVWFFVTAILGTPGVTTCELRNYNATGVNKPGTTQHAVQTVSPGTTANKWINVHFATPYSVTIGTVYHVVLADVGWTSGNTVTVDTISIVRNNTTNFALFHSSSTANGFSSVAGVGNSPAMVLKFADGTLLGCPYTTSAAYTSDQLERGMKIEGMTEKLTVCGVAFGNPSVDISGLKIYSGSTAPGGTPDAVISFPTGSGMTGVCYFTPFTMSKNTIYRFVFTYTANSTSPQYYQIEDYATSADLTNCGVGGGGMYGTIDNGAGGWTDQIDFFPNMYLIVKDQVPGGGRSFAVLGV